MHTINLCTGTTGYMPFASKLTAGRGGLLPTLKDMVPKHLYEFFVARRNGTFRNLSIVISYLSYAYICANTRRLKATC